MIDYLFPIFGLGLVVTGIVVKGLILARDMADAQTACEEQPHPEFDNDQIRARSAPRSLRSTPFGNDRAENRSH